MDWIHGTFLTNDGFYLWGEGPEGQRNTGLWPFALAEENLTNVLARAFNLRIHKTKALMGQFPAVDGQAIPSTPLLGDIPSGIRNTKLRSWKIPAGCLREGLAIELLSGIEVTRVEPGTFCAADLLYWSSLARFALHLVMNQKFIPGVAQNFAIWHPVLLGEDKARFHQLARMMPPACRAFDPDSGNEALARSFVEFVIHATVAEASADRPRPQQTLHDRWLSALQIFPRPPIEELSQIKQSILQWSGPLLRRTTFDYRLAFRLEEPTRKKDYWYVRFFLQKESEPGLYMPLEKLWKATKTAVYLFGDSVQLAFENALVALSQAGKIDSSVEMSLMQAQPAGYQTDSHGAWDFLNTKAWLLQDAGFGILLPSWWGRKKSNLGLGLRVKAKGAGKRAFTGAGSDLMIDLDWKLAIGKHEISYEEFMALARLKAPLIKFRGKWIELRPQQVEAAKEFWKSQELRHGNLSDFLKLLSGVQEIGGELPVTNVEATGWLSRFLHQFQTHASYRLLPVPDNFCGKLRDYQHRGFSWLYFLKTYGLGACLADDMGLGKTIQSIALLLADRQNGGKRPVLLICPTSVVGNWQRELERFAPSLRVMLHHGIGRKKGVEFKTHIQEFDVVLSSYSLLLRDIETLGEMKWRGVILDEAQNIKNAETKQARAARALEADFRIALTGTPVENNIGELWSIFEFLNPGLLGTRAEFKERYFVPIHSMNSPEAADELKKITGPFLLRRLKTDPDIVSELPRKMEMKVFCNLTPEQASLYAAAVKALEKDLEDAEGIERKGKILASILKLKQICNHPAHFLKDGSPMEGRSGKLSRLSEMLEEVMALEERALIFTQFVELGELLQDYLQNYFGREVAFLHGGVPRLRREDLVQRFNEDPDGPPLFLLSLKAGGIGLNLTRANHVFHFDRWWNPAVEDQATDRAYRIGQKKNVQVHKMICVGTLEERIDQMIENKKSIARSIVGTGEAWLTELSTSEIKALVALSKDAVSV